MTRAKRDRPKVKAPGVVLGLNQSGARLPEKLDPEQVPDDFRKEFFDRVFPQIIADLEAMRSEMLDHSSNLVDLHVALGDLKAAQRARLAKVAGNKRFAELIEQARAGHLLRDQLESVLTRTWKRACLKATRERRSGNRSPVRTDRDSFHLRLVESLDREAEAKVLTKLSAALPGVTKITDVVELAEKGLKSRRSLESAASARNLKLEQKHDEWLRLAVEMKRSNPKLSSRAMAISIAKRQKLKRFETVYKVLRQRRPK